MADAPKADQKILGKKYRLLQLLDNREGNFAEVHLGEHIYLHTKHAIKILRTSLRRSEDIEQFRNEASLVAHLGYHDHMIQVTDFDIEDDGTPFLVMTYAPNGSLRKRHPKGTKLSLTTIVSYTKQIADALQYAHTKKIVHRDVKPENMLLGANNQLLLSDFGLAITIASSKIDPQYIAGTAFYMAPEQFNGLSQQASDQYALAIVVYEWLCGKPPFTNGDLLQLGFQHTHTPPPPLRAQIPNLPEGIEQVVMQGLAKIPADRFASVQDFAYALDKASMLPGEAFYPSHVAKAMRECYHQWLEKAEWGEAQNVTEEAKPIRSQGRKTKGYYYPFTNGAIYWSQQSDAQPIWGKFAEIHEKERDKDGIKLGLPLTAELAAKPSPQRTTGRYQCFEGSREYPVDVSTLSIRHGATLYYSEKYGAFSTRGEIGICYERLRGTQGPLGFPISTEQDIGPAKTEHQTKGRYQRFEGGTIYWSRSSAAQAVLDPIATVYQQEGEANNLLGFPVTKEQEAKKSHKGTPGKVQRFEGPRDYPESATKHTVRCGASIYSSKHGTYITWGMIGIAYESIGNTASILGFPTSAEIEVAPSPEKKYWYQHFEGGDIYFRVQNGSAIIISKSILHIFNHFGGLEGKFGFPSASETTVEGHPELLMQEFEGGVICVAKETQ